MTLGTLDSDHTFALTVGGVSCWAYHVNGSLQWTDVAGAEVDTFRIALEDVTNTLAVTEYQEVVFSIDGTPAFGGYVSRARPNTAPGGTHRIWELVCEGYVTRLPKSLAIRKTWVNQTVGGIAADIFTQAGISGFDTATYVDTGPTLATFVSDGERAHTLLNRLVELASDAEGTDWLWNIRADKKLYMRPAEDDNAPFGLEDADTADWSTTYPVNDTPTIDIDASTIYNRITVRGGVRPGSEITDNFTGDASTTLFALTYRPVSDIVRITVNGTLQRYGVDWYDVFGSGYDVLVDYNSSTIRFPDALPPAAAAAIVVVYRQNVAVTVTVSDAASYAHYGNLWFDYEYSDSSITTEDTATAIANLLLYFLAYGVLSGSAVVERYGIRAGQQLAVKFATLGVNANYAVRRVVMALNADESTLVCGIAFGGQADRLSSAIGSIGGGGVAQQPHLNGEVEILRVRTRIELLNASTSYVEP